MLLIWMEGYSHKVAMMANGGGGVTGVLWIADIGLFRCGNAEIEHHFCGLRIFVVFLRNADISAN